MKIRSILPFLTIAGLLSTAGCTDPNGGSAPPIIPETVTVPGSTFPTGTDDSGEQTVIKLYLGATEVTWEQWTFIREWATSPERGSEIYAFQWEGRMGSNGDDNYYMDRYHPVTCVRRDDAMVWCNALTEYCLANDLVESDMRCVYIDSSNTPIRDSSDIGNLVDADNPNARFINGGFRLPGTWEWECAARYLGSSDPGYGIEYPAGSGNWWTPGNFASGSDAVAYIDDSSDENRDPNPGSSCAVAWYSPHADSRTRAVGSSGRSGEDNPSPLTGTPNALGIYDMSGNVAELCIVDPESEDWTTRGGSWNTGAEEIRVGDDSDLIANTTSPHSLLGFRVARSEPIHIWGD